MYKTEEEITKKAKETLDGDTELPENTSKVFEGAIKIFATINSVDGISEEEFESKLITFLFTFAQSLGI